MTHDLSIDEIMLCLPKLGDSIKRRAFVVFYVHALQVTSKLFVFSSIAYSSSEIGF